MAGISEIYAANAMMNSQDRYEKGGLTFDSHTATFIKNYREY